MLLGALGLGWRGWGGGRFERSTALLSECMYSVQRSTTTICDAVGETKVSIPEAHTLVPLTVDTTCPYLPIELLSHRTQTHFSKAYTRKSMDTFKDCCEPVNCFRQTPSRSHGPVL